jgi:hypothetical protein
MLRESTIKCKDHIAGIGTLIQRFNRCRGTVAVFLSASDDVDDFGVLNEVICAWREDEQMTRGECGLDPVDSIYDGCPDYRKNETVRRNRDLRVTPDRISPNDILLRNMLNLASDRNAKSVIIRSDNDLDDGEADDAIDTDERRLLYDFNGTEELNWNNYFALDHVNTEYFFRYAGTQTIPPCYGTFLEGDNRKQTNHWR